MKIIALDIGEKRTGVAISNNISTMCTPLDYIKSEDLEFFITELSIIINQNEVDKIIIGLPKLMNGKEGSRAKFSRFISKKIKENILNIKIILWDERLTTKEAEKNLIQSGIKKTKIKEKIDSESAVLILENYLNTQRKQ
ncbi:MAG: Holliday junction resolvase RuvX [Dehalococcoidales bacterium]|nr:Holliday junction resolvase RuvX [Dehalococcoidales bacterium]